MEHYFDTMAEDTDLSMSILRQQETFSQQSVTIYNVGNPIYDFNYRPSLLEPIAEREIAKAVQFIIDLVRNLPRPNGYIEFEDRLDLFQRHLASILTIRLFDHWNVFFPNIGREHRQIRFADGQIDCSIVEAASLAYLSVLELNLQYLNLTISIDPGLVVVHLGDTNGPFLANY